MENKLQYELVTTHKGILYARLYDPSTKKSEIHQHSIEEYVPPIFLPSKSQSSPYRSFTNNTPLDIKTYPNIYDASKSIKNYEELGIEVYGNTNRSQYYISTNYPEPLKSSHTFRTWFIDIEVRSIGGYASTDNPVEEISLIQVYDNFTNKFYLLATRDCDEIPSSPFGEVKYIKYETEKDMMRSFIKMVQTMDPTVICGFNSNFFDIPYITNRIERLKLPKSSLSPIGLVTETQSYTMDKIEYTKFDWVGRYLLDYRELFVKYSFDKLPKYSLEYVATHVLGSGKVKHDEYESLEDLYINNYNTFVQYGLTDIELLLQMDNKLKMIDTAKMIAYTCGVNIYDVFGTLRQWSSFMFNESMKLGKVLPIKQQHNDPYAVYVGGWTKSSPGKHDWVVSYDFSSLYPSNIRTLNIGVDTLIKEDEIPLELKELREKYFNYYTQKNINVIRSSNNNQEELQFFKKLMENKDEINSVVKKYNVCVTPNGKFYRKDAQSVFAGLMGRLYADRKVEQKKAKEYKKQLDELGEDTPKDIINEIKSSFEYHDLMQYTLKILLNSSYGSTALDYNQFSFGEGMAASITTTGRLANRWVAYQVNSKIKELLKLEKLSIEKVPFTIQADTDSNYFTVDGIIKKKFPNGMESKQEGIELVESICDKILEPIIHQAIKDVTELLNAYDDTILDMERETVFSTLVSVADKRYFGVYNKNNEPKYKITGLSLIGKSTPEWCKTKLKPVLGLIADKTPLDIMSYVEDIKAEFTSVDLKSVCVVKGVSAVDYFQEGGKFYKYGETGRKNPAPFHSRGAIIHNMVLDKNNDSKYTRIKAGDKIYVLPLTIPNPFYNQNVICFTNPNFVDEYNITPYIDYDTMFEKNFLGNIKLITDPIGWKLDKFSGVMDDWE